MLSRQRYSYSYSYSAEKYKTTIRYTPNVYRLLSRRLQVRRRRTFPPKRFETTSRRLGARAFPFPLPLRSRNPPPPSRRRRGPRRRPQRPPPPGRRRCRRHRPARRRTSRASTTSTWPSSAAWLLSPTLPLNGPSESVLPTNRAATASFSTWLPSSPGLGVRLVFLRHDFGRRPLAVTWHSTPLGCFESAKH